MTRAACIWIENNPETGSIKPWEVWFQAEGGRKHRIASCMTEGAARKSMAATMKRNAPHYNLTEVAA